MYPSKLSHSFWTPIRWRLAPGGTGADYFTVRTGCIYITPGIDIPIIRIMFLKIHRAVIRVLLAVLLPVLFRCRPLAVETFTTIPFLFALIFIDNTGLILAKPVIITLCRAIKITVNIA
jgi:hypothetical protein